MAANSWVGAAAQQGSAARRASRSAQRWTALACLLAGCALAQDLITVHIVPHTHDGARRARVPPRWIEGSLAVLARADVGWLKTVGERVRRVCVTGSALTQAAHAQTSTTWARCAAGGREFAALSSV